MHLSGGNITKKTPRMLSKTAPRNHNAFNRKWKPQHVEHHCAVNSSLCACDITVTPVSSCVCFLFPGESGIAAFPVALSWRVFIRENLSVHFNTELFCLTKAEPSILLSAHQRVLSSPGPARPSGLRQTFAYELLPGHILLSRKHREEKRVQIHTPPCANRSVHPSSKSERVHTPPLPLLLSGSKSGFVSKALFNPTRSRGQSQSPTASSVSSNTAAFSTTLNL